MRATAIWGCWLTAAMGWSVSAAGQEIDLSSIAVVNGVCERLVVAGADRSASCNRVLTNLSYHSGRTSFLFVDRTGGDNGTQAAISFSGIGAPADGDHGRLTLDMVSRAVQRNGTVDVQSEPIAGHCDYENPYGGRATIRCEGTTASGAYRGTFVSDGAPPRVAEMPPRP